MVTAARVLADVPELLLITEIFIDSYDNGPQLSFISSNYLSKKLENRNERKCHGYSHLRNRIKHKFCLVCGKTENLTVDYIVPRHKGGSVNAKENLMFLCKEHNSVKGSKMPNDWLRVIIPKRVKGFCHERFRILSRTVENAMKFYSQTNMGRKN